MLKGHSSGLPLGPSASFPRECSCLAVRQYLQRRKALTRGVPTVAVLLR
jgi:hypothetical protein